MEVSTTVIRQSVCFLRGAGESSSFSAKRRVIGRQRSAVVVRPWSDEGHRLYYASQTRCGGVRDAKRKEEKKRAALVTELSRDLAALYSTGLGMDGAEGNDGEVRGKMIKARLQKKLDDLVSLVGSMTKTTKEKHAESPRFSYVPYSVDHASQKTPHYTNRGHYCGRDHPSLSNIRVAAPPYRSSPSLDGRPSIGSSFGSVSYDSPLGPTPSYLSQPLASPYLDLVSEILVEKCIRKKRSPEPETECIHFVDANDITDNEDFFEDETEVIKLDSLYDLNPDLGVLVPLDLDTLIHPDPNLIKDIPLDKVCMDDINLIPKEVDLILNTLKLNSEDSDLIVSPTKETSNNSDLILNNSDEDNLDLEVNQLDLLPELDPDLIDPKSIELRVMTKHDPIENTNMSLEDINLKLKDFELNWNNEHSLVLLESILGVAQLDLHLKESVLPDWAYHITPPTDWNENISPRFHVVPTSNLDTLPRLLSPIHAGDSWGYVIMVESDDPLSYHTPDSYIFPATSSSFPIKDHLSPSWLTLLDYTTATGRISMTLVETSYRNALEAAELLLVQLNQLKTKEKEMKKRKNEEKEALKAAKIRDCAEMSSSSSSESSDSECEVVVMNKPGKNFQEVKPNILDVPDLSPESNQAKMRNYAEMSSSSSSESSDSECEVVMMNKPGKNLQEVKPNILDVPDQSPECNQAESSLEIEVDEKAELNHTELKLEQELSSRNCMNNAAVVDCSSSVVAVAKPLDKIEVCMGGKCKKSGAIGLLQELEKKVGIEGAVVGCKCMGKCKEGPNVRIVNHYKLQDELGEVSKKPLCIGVGLEDVSVIVANFLGEKNIDMGLYGA
ncbi:hypothetical protein M5K25_021679 [Dendrobium thyrsiflorum]|uniref:Diacylglycerol O-acyltransferase 3, cytosolic n=1 Tax=Dendrobium thyrsiflorum TaxID=117978 RepID=A0ABD0U4R9_DENTH